VRDNKAVSMGDGLQLFVASMVMFFLSKGIRKKARQLGVNYSFLFIRAEGSQLAKITN
jgi:hypothetical protein